VSAAHSVARDVRSKRELARPQIVAGPDDEEVLTYS